MAARVTTFYLKRGDRLRTLRAVLTEVGVPVIPLTGTVRFYMRRRGEPGIVVSGAATITNAATREVEYAWAGGDTDAAGEYDGEFEVTVDGKAQSFPNDSYIPIVITADIGP